MSLTLTRKSCIQTTILILAMTLNSVHLFTTEMEDTDLAGCTVQLSSYIFNLKGLEKTNS
jgi:hypothetical protein